MKTLTHRAAVGVALVVVFLWATSWVLIKAGLDEIPALTFAGLRYTLAFVCLLPFSLARWRRGEVGLFTGKAWRQLLLLGVLFYAVTQGASFVALAYLPAITVNLAWSFSSVLVAVLGVMFLGERPGWRQWLGVGLAVAGAVVFFAPWRWGAGSEGQGYGELAYVGFAAAAVGVLANAVSSILGRGVNRSGRLDPLVVTTVSMGSGAVVLLVTGLITQGLPVISWQGWAIIAWLAVVNTAVAFTLWNRTLQTLSAVESSVINGTMLLWIPLLAVAFLGESLTGIELAGLVVVGVGTLLVQLKRIPNNKDAP